jgi:hypothetical protein
MSEKPSCGARPTLAGGTPAMAYSVVARLIDPEKTIESPNSSHFRIIFG